MVVKTIYNRFAYLIPQSPDRILLPFQIRDSDASNQIESALYSLGYFIYGDSYLNYPATDAPKVTPMDISVFDSNHLFCCTTRPPMNDSEEAGKKIVHRSYTTLEIKLFDILKQYIYYCSRSKVQIQESLVREFPKEYMDRAIIEFHIYRSPVITSHKCINDLKWKRPDRPRTALYFLHAPSLRKGDPQVLVAFGLSGTDTIVWCTYLRKYSNELGLGSPRFILAEMEGEMPEKPQSISSLLGEFQVNILVNIPLRKVVTG
jgi:hypothetical protein